MNRTSTISSIFLACILSFVCHAAPSEADWKNFNHATVNSFVIPFYQSLSTASQALQQSTQGLCQSPSQEALDNSIGDFHKTMDAWQSIQNITFGPIEFSMRSHSLQFWPDKKNHIGKHLGVLLASDDKTLLNEDKFQRASISVKGLPAIERILFKQSALNELKANKFHCDVLTTISQNVSTISTSLHSEWLKHMRGQFADAKQLDGYFEDDIDAATALLKTMIEPLEVIRDLKLKRPLGSAFGKEKYKRLESWRSQRSLRNIELNILSLQLMFEGLANILPPERYHSISHQYTALVDAIRQINTPLENAIRTAEGYQATLDIYKKIGTLHKELETSVSALGIHLGFNSRDGD